MHNQLLGFFGNAGIVLHLFRRTRVLDNKSHSLNFVTCTNWIYSEHCTALKYSHASRYELNAFPQNVHEKFVSWGMTVYTVII